MIEFKCDICGSRFRLPEESAGKKGKCPKCGCPIRVPALASSPSGQPIQSQSPAPVPAGWAKPAEPRRGFLKGLLTWLGCVVVGVLGGALVGLLWIVPSTIVRHRWSWDQAFTVGLLGGMFIGALGGSIYGVSKAIKPGARRKIRVLIGAIVGAAHGALLVTVVAFGVDFESLAGPAMGFCCTVPFLTFVGAALVAEFEGSSTKRRRRSKPAKATQSKPEESEGKR